jgi:hypothetical protein
MRFHIHYVLKDNVWQLYDENNNIWAYFGDYQKMCKIAFWMVLRKKQ